jgi:hypothetical protein
MSFFRKLFHPQLRREFTVKLPAERAWRYLARLEQVLPTTRLAVRSKSPAGLRRPMKGDSPRVPRPLNEHSTKSGR